MKSNIGEFLAILRKSKGMTQQEAANWLGVSNKTVSSWETGASCPDISMLPSLAELYGVTCDELLRGERISAEESPEKREEKREKSLARLLAMYRNNAAVTSWICAGLYVTAAIAALLIGARHWRALSDFLWGSFSPSAGCFCASYKINICAFNLRRTTLTAPPSINFPVS